MLRPPLVDLEKGPAPAFLVHDIVQGGGRFRADRGFGGLFLRGQAVSGDEEGGHDATAHTSAITNAVTIATSPHRFLLISNSATIALSVESSVGLTTRPPWSGALLMLTSRGGRRF